MRINAKKITINKYKREEGSPGQVRAGPTPPKTQERYRYSYVVV